MRPVFFLLIFSGFSAAAQADFYEKYYPAIDRAEYAFTQDNFTEAISHYAEAFQAVDVPLARDLYNGVVCYYLAGNIDGAKSWLLLLARKGIDPAVLENQEVFMVENIREEWEAFKPVYRQISDRFVPEKDEATDELIRSVQEKMLEIRGLHNTLPDAYFEMDSLTVLSEADSLAIATIETRMESIYDSMSHTAAAHILRYGFPAEERYGLVDLTMDALRSFLSNIRFYTLLSEDSTYSLAALNEKLMEEVGKGHVHRDYVLDLLEAGGLEFVRLHIAEELPCYVPGVPVFVSPRADHSVDLLVDDNEERRIAKGYYSVFENKYFLMNEGSRYEDRPADTCEQVMEVNEKLIRVGKPTE